MEIANSNYKLTFEVRPGYLYARIEAPAIDRETSLEYLTQIALKCGSLRMKKLLIDRDIPAILDDAGLTSVLADYVRLSSGMTIAFVNQHADLDIAMQNAIRTIPGRAVQFNYFTDVKAAEDWLLAQSIPDLFTGSI